jgi:hypothetical protein
MGASNDTGCEDEAMNDDPAGNRGTRRSGHAAVTREGTAAVTRAGLVAVTAAAAVLVAACGGSAAPPAGPAAGGSARYQQALAYSRCMRGHGVPDFPDPDAAGNIIQHVTSGQPPDNGPRAQAADNICHHLLAGGGAPNSGASRRIVSQLLRLAGCMRGHGEPNFPDPTVSGTSPKGTDVSLPGGITLGLAAAGIDVGSAQYQAAEQACRALAPPGLFSTAHHGQ